MVDESKVVQINARITLQEKLELMALAKKKGVGGITNLLQLLAKAKSVSIKV